MKRERDVVEKALLGFVVQEVIKAAGVFESRLGSRNTHFRPQSELKPNIFVISKFCPLDSGNWAFSQLI